MFQAIGAAILAVAFAAIFVWTLGQDGSLAYPMNYPQWILAAIAVLFAAAIFVKPPAADPHHAEQQVEPGEAGGRWPLAATILLCILYVWAWQWIGFLLSTFLYVGCQLLILNQRDLRLVLGEAALVTLVLYVVFQRLLMLPLPPGELFS